MILKLIKSSAFRLTLLYIGMFGASAAVLILFIYLFMERELENQIRHNVNIQLADLGRKFVLYGNGETIASIDHLMKNDKDKTAIYMLIDPKWEVLAGNMKTWPGGSTKHKDWIKFPYENEETGKKTQAIAISSALPDGYILVVGSTLQNLEKIGDIMLKWLSVIISITIVMALMGGMITALNINGRIESINQVCRRVMRGELERRVKVLGSGDAFDKLAENFNLMMGRICELIDGIRDISASVAHDLRTPLNRVRHRLENITAGNVDRNQINKEIDKAIKEIDDLTGTFNAILRISQAEAGAGKEKFEDFDLSEQIESVIELYSAVAEENNIQLTTKIEKEIKIHGDKHLLSQAVANLVDNALKYTPAGGKVEIAITRKKKEIIMSVADNGPGIPKEFYNKVTEKFFRLESSRNTPGNGLGMSLASAAVKMHDGKFILSDNNPGLKINIILHAADV